MKKDMNIRNNEIQECTFSVSLDFTIFYFQQVILIFIL